MWHSIAPLLLYVLLLDKARAQTHCPAPCSGHGQLSAGVSSNPSTNLVCFDPVQYSDNNKFNFCLPANYQNNNGATDNTNLNHGVLVQTCLNGGSIDPYCIQVTGAPSASPTNSPSQSPSVSPSTQIHVLPIPHKVYPA